MRKVNPFLLFPELPSNNMLKHVQDQARIAQDTLLDSELADAADADPELDCELADALNLRD